MLSGSPVVASGEQLLERFVAAGARQRRTLLPQLLQRGDELLPLIAAQLDQIDPQGDDWAAGTLLQLWRERSRDTSAEPWWAQHADGWLQAPSAAGLSYAPLQQALLEQRFEDADRLTSQHLRELAGEGAQRRGYVYYSEVPGMPALDLQSLDRLWICFSQARFGFSVQLRLLRSCNLNWDQLWPRIGWKQAGIWTRYPGSFTWSLEAPEGHMPLINQLRGVRLMDALLNHPGIQQRLA